MRKSVFLAALYLSIAASTLCATTMVEQFGFSIRDFAVAYQKMIQNNPAAREALGPLRKQLDAVFLNRKSLAEASAKALSIDVKNIEVVEYSKFDRTKTTGKFLIAIEPIYGFLNSNDGSIGYQLMYEQHAGPVHEVDAKAIAREFNAIISPELTKISQDFFDKHFGPILVDAQQAKESAEKKANQLESERRDLQLRSYEELPYEKVSDHLADLQRQQLALKLSLVGMDAKKGEIEKQLELAQLRIKTNADRAEKESASSETIDILKKLVDLKSKQLGYVMEAQKKAPGSVTTVEIDEANARVLEAKLQLLAATNKKPSAAGNDRLEALNAELTRLAIDRSEQSARSKYLDEMRQEAQIRIETRAGLDQRIKRIDEQLPGSKSALRNAENRLKEIEAAKSNFKPIDLTKSDN